MEKPAVEVCNEVRIKPACSATEASNNLEILDLANEANIGIILSRQQIIKALNRLICVFVRSHMTTGSS